MKIAILAAMDKEMALLQKILVEPENFEKDGISGLKGRVGRHEVILAKCGIGKVNSALNTFKIIRAFNPDLVINSGVAGGAGGLKVGDLLVAGGVGYHDVWCGPGTKWGAADGFPVIIHPSRKVLDIARSAMDSESTSFGLIATGDTFISTAEEIEKIHSIFPEAVAVDMESAAIGQTCFSEGVEFAIVRVVSDTPGEADNLSQYKNFWSEAPEKTFNALKIILEKL